MARDAIRKSLSWYLYDEDVERLENCLYDICKKSNLSYDEIAYEKVGQISTNPDSIEQVITDVKNIAIGYDSCVYEEYYNDYMRKLDKSQQKPTPTKGVYVCKNKHAITGKICGSDEFYVWSKQTRSADEGMTIMRECAKCGKRGREN
jgi:DNA-directed RNA polymerase subunit M/transcription elongation factor TFIIS